MAIFKKLNIGEAVATSGTRCFKKLTTAEVTPDDPTLPIWNGTDLKGTTWKIPDSGWTAEAGYGEFDVIGKLNYLVDYDFRMFRIGYAVQSAHSTPFIAADNICWDTVFADGSVRCASIDNNRNDDGILLVDTYEFTFTGGTDVTNPRLIDWLLENGRLTSHQRMPKLVAPTISLDGDFILITNNNAVAINKYDLYINGVFRKTVKRETAFDLRGYFTELGTYDVCIVAVKNGYENSTLSNTVKYVYEEYEIQAGTYVFNEVLPIFGYPKEELVVYFHMAWEVDSTSFTSNGTSYNLLGIESYADDSFMIAYSYLYGNNLTRYRDYAYWYGDDDYEDGWQNENFRTINLLKGKTHRSKSLHEWWIANTTKVS